jgi:hypothetical protein
VNDDLILNWKNTLQQSPRGSQMVAAQQASDYHKRGYSPEDALEIMAANGIELRLAQSAIEGIWGNYRFASQNSGGAVATDLEIGYSPKVTMVPIVPVEYADVAPIVEDQLLRRLSAREFVNRLCRTASPIIPVGQKDLNSLYGWAERAADDDRIMEQFHGILAPFFETTMLANVEAAQNYENRLRVAEVSGPRVLVASENRYSSSVECDIEMGRCSCDKFKEGHYADFGMACEHLIHAADTLSPMERLQRPFSG